MMKNAADPTVQMILEEIFHEPPTHNEILEELDRRLVTADGHEKKCLQYYRELVEQQDYDASSFLRQLNAEGPALRQVPQSEKVRQNIVIVQELRTWITRG